MADKRIRNRSTGKYYKIRERNSLYGRKGEIMGLWHNREEQGPKKKRRLPPRDEKGRFRKDKRRKEHKKEGLIKRLLGL